MVDPSKLEQVLASIRKNYGKEAVMAGSEKSEVQKISFNDVQLNWATEGGVPMGRYSHFYGPESAGKSLVSFKIIAEAQRMGMSAAFYDVEKTFVPSWAEKMGVDISKLLVLRPTIIEEIGTQIETMMEAVNIHVVDSIPASSPLGELAADLGDQQIGLFARTWGKVLRRLQHRLTDEHALILINQLRTAFKGRVTVEEPSGGKFIRHEAALAIEFKKGPRLFYKNDVLSPDGDKTKSPTEDVRPDGIELICHIAKSKVSMPLKTARVRLDFSSGQFDEAWSLAMFANHFGLAEKSGAWYSILGNGKKVQGENGLRAYILQNPDYEYQIRNKVEETWKTLKN